MEFTEEERNIIRRYLLGELDEEQCQQLEEHIFTSPAFKTQVEMVEDELAEDYLAGRLPANDWNAFRQRLLLTPGQNQRIEIISALRTFAAQHPPSSLVRAEATRAHHSGGFNLLAFLVSSHPRSMLAAAAIIVIVVGSAGWLIRHISKTGQNPDDLIRRREIELEVSRLNPSGGQPLPPELTATASHILSVGLNPNILSRSGGELTKVEVLNRVTIVQFHLKLPLDDHDSYRVALYTSEGVELLRHDGMAAQTLNGFKDMIFNLPSSALPPGDYQLRLSGRYSTNRTEEVAEYGFRVALQNTR